MRNRTELIPLLEDLTRKRPACERLSRLEGIGVPAGPDNDLQQVFASPQVEAREMTVTLDHPSSASGQVELNGNPVKLSDTPVAYDRAPPVLAQHIKAALNTKFELVRR